MSELVHEGERPVEDEQDQERESQRLSRQAEPMEADDSEEGGQADQHERGHDDLCRKCEGVFERAFVRGADGTLGGLPLDRQRAGELPGSFARFG